MATYRYNSIKFTYTNDEGTDVLKLQRQYINPSTEQPFVPLTPLFDVRRITSSLKTDKTDLDMRHIKAYVDNPNATDNYSEFKQYIPYAPNDVNLKNHIREIIALDILCGDYKGEDRDYVK